MTMRPVKPLVLPDFIHAPAVEEAPQIHMLRPTDLMVDEAYQRELSKSSIRLIHRIVKGFSWRRFKPPIVAHVGDEFHVIDGQHTAIGAATAGVPFIPVLVVAAQEVADRADAFVGHNRERLSVSPYQVHRALVAAGDEDALTIDQVCERAGVTILPFSTGSTYEPGQTLAYASIKALCYRRTAQKAREVLEILARARVAPISMDQIRATEVVVCEIGLGADDLVEAYIDRWPLIWRDACTLAITRGLPKWRGLVIAIQQHAKKKRVANG